MLRRSQLVTPPTLVPQFNGIRNFLAANATGITRDTAIVSELARILFCKSYDELQKKPDEVVDFQVKPGESLTEVEKRIRGLFQAVKQDRSAIFDQDEEIALDARSLSYVVEVLQKYEITRAKRDALGEAFETLIGPTLRGGEGQFFTPRNLVRLMIRMINPKPHERVIDPACGSGGFLVIALEHVQKALEMQNKFSEGVERDSEKIADNIVGIEKDAFLAKLASVYLAIVRNHHPYTPKQIFCENSLAPPDMWSVETQRKAELASFDVVVTNPPFGSRIPVNGSRILSQYSLARLWKTKKKKQEVQYIQTDRLKEAEAPQILFIERCLQFLRDSGRMAIVLPEGILGNAITGYVRKFIREEAEIVAVIDCPLETFLPSTPTKVGVLVLQKRSNPAKKPVFMAIADRCGHNRRGIPLKRADGALDDDFPIIADAFDAFRSKHNVSF